MLSLPSSPSLLCSSTFPPSTLPSHLLPRLLPRKHLIIHLYLSTTQQDPKNTPSSPLSSLPLPLLSIHAADDPIIHVDTLPCRSGILKNIDNLVIQYNKIKLNLNREVFYKFIFYLFDLPSILWYYSTFFKYFLTSFFSVIFLFLLPSLVVIYISSL